MIRAVFKYNEIHLAEKDIQKTFFLNMWMGSFQKLQHHYS